MLRRIISGKRFSTGIGFPNDRSVMQSTGSIHRELAQTLATSIKEMETKYSISLEEGKPFVIRLDGCSFKKYTSGMVRPFDQRLTLSMVKTMNDLVEHFNPVFAYTQSDEISLVFKGGDRSLDYLPYSGRVPKLCSIAAGLASARFNYHISSCDWSDRLLEVQKKIELKSAYFDARVFSTPDQKGAADAIVWRHVFDCRRNAIHTIGIAHFGHKSMHCMSIGEIISMLSLKRNIDINRDTPRIFLFGTFCKKSLVPHPFTNPITKETGTVIRSRIENRIFDMSGMKIPEIVSMVFESHWSENHPISLCDMTSIFSAESAPLSEKELTLEPGETN